MALTVAPDFTDGILTASSLQQLSDAINQRTPLYVIKSLDETVNNSAVLQDDNELLLPVEANLTYHLASRITFTSGTTPDFKFAWTFPTGLTMTYNLTCFAVGTSVLDQFAFTQTLTANLEGGASQRSAMIEGQVVVGSTAGTLQLQWAQITATGSDTIVKAGSFIELRRWT